MGWGGGGGERERRWGAPRPDWPSGRPAVTATVHGHHAQGPEGAGAAPRACGVWRGRGRVWGGTWNVAPGAWAWGSGRLRQGSSLRTRASYAPPPPPNKLTRGKRQPQGHAHQVHRSHANWPQGHRHGASTAPAATWSSGRRAQVEGEGAGVRPARPRRTDGCGAEPRACYAKGESGRDTQPGRGTPHAAHGTRRGWRARGRGCAGDYSSRF